MRKPKLQQRKKILIMICLPVFVVVFIYIYIYIYIVVNRAPNPSSYLPLMLL